MKQWKIDELVAKLLNPAPREIPEVKGETVKQAAERLKRETGFANPNVLQFTPIYRRRRGS
jgi:hypothetical protein